jgi:hypothetical protein
LEQLVYKAQAAMTRPAGICGVDRGRHGANLADFFGFGRSVAGIGILGQHDANLVDFCVSGWMDMRIDMESSKAGRADQYASEYKAH